MIFLFVLALSAMADEPEDKSAQIFSSYCVSCHGANLEKIPLKEDSTTKQRVQAINTGVKNMPPYNWILSDGEAERLVRYMEKIK
jgi:mono/diheme cytochrome c family protein